MDSAGQQQAAPPNPVPTPFDGLAETCNAILRSQQQKLGGFVATMQRTQNFPLGLPTFDGAPTSNVRTWIFQLEAQFAASGTPEDQRLLRLPPLHSGRNSKKAGHK